jgi:hypothetical protein
VTRMVGRGPLSANCPGSLFAAASEMLRDIYIYHSPVASRAERPGPAAQIVTPPPRPVPGAEKALLHLPGPTGPAGWGPR